MSAIQRFLYCSLVRNMSKKENNGNAIANDSLRMEWLDLLAARTLSNQCQGSEGLKLFTDDFYSYFQKITSDKEYLSHARYVIKTLSSIALNLYETEDFRKLLLNPGYVLEVLETLTLTKSFSSKRKPIFKHVLYYYFGLINLHPLSPEKYTIQNLIDRYGQEPISKKPTVYENHPMIDVLLAYITEKKQKWQKRARIQVRVFFKWLVTKGYYNSIMEIDVSEITYEILLQYKEHLYNRVKNKNLTVESAQLYLQTLKRFFSILKNRGKITVNPATKLRNFNVKKNKKKKEKVILTLEELKLFFESILSDSNSFFWYMVFGIQATLALRASEVLRIKREDVNLKTGEVFIYRKYHKDQTLPLTGLPWLLLEKYIESNSILPSDQLWKNSRGDILTYSNLLEKFHYFRDKAGITSIKGATHNFRHLLLTELCMQEQDLRKLKVFADVESEKTLNTYIHGRPQEIYQVFQEYYKPTGVDIKWQL